MVIMPEDSAASLGCDRNTWRVHLDALLSFRATIRGEDMVTMPKDANGPGWVKLGRELFVSVIILPVFRFETL
jgi:hypothetical protein